MRLSFGLRGIINSLIEDRFCLSTPSYEVIISFASFLLQCNQEPSSMVTMSSNTKQRNLTLLLAYPALEEGGAVSLSD